jgi:hypothetical protein
MMPVASAMNDEPPFGPDMMGHMPANEFGMNDDFM